MQQPAMQCPKCQSAMHTHNRNGVHIEQCTGCRGIFLDFGELEAMTQLQGQWMQQMMPPPGPPPQQHQQQPAWGAPPQQPAWGAPQQPGYGYGPGHGHHKPYKKSFMGMLFSS